MLSLMFCSRHPKFLIVFEQEALQLPVSLCPANCVTSTGPGVFPRIGLVLTALTCPSCPRQTTDVPIHGALYVIENKCASAAQMCV